MVCGWNWFTTMFSGGFRVTTSSHTLHFCNSLVTFCYFYSARIVSVLF